MVASSQRLPVLGAARIVTGSYVKRRKAPHPLLFSLDEGAIVRLACLRLLDLYNTRRLLNTTSQDSGYRILEDDMMLWRRT